MYKNFFKRFFDFWIALIALVCISPLLVVVTIWLHFANKRKNENENQNENVKGWLKRWLEPVIFTQERPGKDAKIFKVIKFKSMTDERDENGELLPEEQRLTKVGKFIRSTSIDELPQFINVLKGEMALIGPRPLRVKYLPLYSKEQARRHDVRPGISGWAQCHGRNTISWKQKFEYDVWYVDHISLWTDLKIIFMTIKKVFSREDINSINDTIMEDFDGTN